MYTITLYTSQHQEISWEVFAKKSADIFSCRISFITISTFRYGLNGIFASRPFNSNISKRMECLNQILFSDVPRNSTKEILIDRVFKGQLISECPFGPKLLPTYQRNYCLISALKFFVASWGLPVGFIVYNITY